MGKFSDSLISGLGNGIAGAGLGLIGSIGAGRRQEKAIEAQKEAQMASCFNIQTNRKPERSQWWKWRRERRQL